MPNLSGLFGIYWVNLQRDFVGNSCSSIVIFSPGLLQLMLLSINLFQMSEIRANLSVCKRVDLVLRKSKRKKRKISRQRFLDMVCGKNDTPHSLFQKLSRGKFLPPYAPRTYSNAINTFSSQSESSHSSLPKTLRALTLVHC